MAITRSPLRWRGSAPKEQRLEVAGTNPLERLTVGSLSTGRCFRDQLQRVCPHCRPARHAFAQQIWMSPVQQRPLGIRYKRRYPRGRFDAHTSTGGPVEPPSDRNRLIGPCTTKLGRGSSHRLREHAHLKPESLHPATAVSKPKRRRGRPRKTEAPASAGSPADDSR